MTPLISVIIPNRNGAATLGPCLAAATGLDDPALEVIVVDDCSRDESAAIIQRFPCRLIPLTAHGGAGRARNAGAAQAEGEILFFTDADCVLRPDTLAQVRRRLAEAPDAALGGTYTPRPFDDQRFFSRFQSVFVNYSESKRPERPDYLATHALAMTAAAFRASGGFAEGGLPILEDVEFSHRLRRAGVRLVLDPAIQVRHIFGFSLLGSLRNAVRKSRYWIVYSLGNRDLLADSGTASLELKFNVGAFALCATLLALAAAGYPPALIAAALAAGANLLVSRRLLGAFHAAAGPWFALGATLYYLGFYPLPVGAGAVAGLADFLRGRRGRGKGP